MTDLNMGLTNTLTLTTEMLGIWAAVVTVALVVIIAVIFRRLRNKSKKVPDAATSYASSYVSSWNDAESTTGMSTKSDDCTSVVDMDADTQSIGPDGSEDPTEPTAAASGSGDQGQTNAAFDSTDFSMIMNDSAPSVQVPVEISEKLNPAMDGDTIGPMASLGPDAEEDTFVTPVHSATPADGSEPAQVNFRHAQFRGLKLSHSGAGSSSFL